MNQCVPSWELDENSGMPGNDLRANSNSNSLLPGVPTLDYEVAELTWKNGQLAMHGLGPPRMGNKPIFTSSPTTKYNTWEKPRAGGTLESIVNQATRLPDPKSALYGGGDELVPWFDHHRAMVHHPAASASVAMTMDALVPCNNNNIIINRNENQVPSARAMESVPHSGTCVVGSSTRVGSCSGAAATLDGGIRGARIERVEINSSDTNGSASESATCGRDSRQLTLDTCDKKLGTTGFTSPSTDSPENTSSAKEYTKSTGDDHDSVCHSRPQREKCEEEGKKRGTGKFSLSTKRSRAAAIHNQSERKRRDRINQRMKTLQKLVPNSSKTDKASMLDEVIEYLKQLQAQVQIMRMNMSPMMLPLAMQQQLQMSMMHQASPMGMGLGMGMGMAGMGMGIPGIGMPGIGIMDINNAMGRPSGMPPPPPTAFMPVAAASWDNPGDHRLSAPAASVMTDPLSAFLACQSQLMTFDAYSRLAAMYQQFQHPPGSNSKN